MHVYGIKSQITDLIILYVLCFMFKGWIYDQTGSYDVGFFFLGFAQATGALIFAADHLRQNCCKNKQK